MFESILWNREVYEPDVFEQDDAQIVNPTDQLVRRLITRASGRKIREVAEVKDELEKEQTT